MLITQDDIQRIGDEETLLHFLEEKLNLPIPEDLPLEDITTKFANFALGLSGVVANQVLDCQELSVSPGESSGIILIRFNSESGYAEALRAVAEGLDRQGRNPVNLYFICMKKDFQPFAFANFNDSASEDWQTAILNIRAWTQKNTHIHTSSEHELPIGFFTNEPSGDFDDKSGIFDEETVTTTSDNEDNKDDPLTNEGIDEEIADNNIVANADSRDKTPVNEPLEILNNKITRHWTNPISSNNLLSKLESVGVPLGQHWNTHSGPAIQPGCSKALVLDKCEYEELIAAEPKSLELLKPVVCIPREQGDHRWKPEWSHLIYIPSSEFKPWPWSNASEATAERIFANTYPRISRHIYSYKDKLKKASPGAKGLFYWELPKRPVHELSQKFSEPKIVYPAERISFDAGYDKSGSLILGHWTCYIPTTDLSLLAILNSILFDYYAKANYQVNHKRKVPPGWLSFKQANMKKFPVANRTGEQKNELSALVQKILKKPNGCKVLNFERKIDQLVYELYELTSAEIALIEEETKP